jgi:F-type H+-transporting ATPase subunit a
MEKGITIHLSPSVLGHVGDIAITNTFFTVMVVSLLLVVFSVIATRKLKLSPGKGQLVLESLIMLPYQFVESTLENAKLARKVFPVIMTLFLLVLCVNWFGLLPFVASIGVMAESHGHTALVPFFYPGATDLNFTLALALIAFFTIEIAGIAALGAFSYAHKFLNFSSPLKFVIGLMELLSEVARIITFAFRLFGNIFAGKVVLLVMMFFMPLFLPIPILAFEVFVGFIQAVIFALLTLFFVKLAVASHDDHSEGHTPTHSHPAPA